MQSSEERLLRGGVVLLAFAIWYGIQRRQDSVTISVSYDLKACKDEQSLLVYISNHSGSVLNRVSWSFAAYPPGRSTDITGYSYSSSDHILQPNAYIGFCYRLPELKEQADPATLRWEADGKTATFAGSWF
jgi:hypothetical protein